MDLPLFPNGTKVSFWTALGEHRYGRVVSTSRLDDHAQIATVVVDSEGEDKGIRLNIPVSALHEV